MLVNACMLYIFPFSSSAHWYLVNHSNNMCAVNQNFLYVSLLSGSLSNLVGSVHASLLTQSEVVKDTVPCDNMALMEDVAVSLHPAQTEGQSQGVVTSGSPATPELNVSGSAKMDGKLVESVMNQEGQAAAPRGNTELSTESTRTLTTCSDTKQQMSEGDVDAGLDLRAAGRNASDRFKRCISEIAANQWDAEAWQAAVAEVQLGRSGGIPARDVCISQFSKMLTFCIKPTYNKC